MRKKKSLSELDIDKLCEELHEIKTLFGTESENDINSSTDNPCEKCLKKIYVWN